MISALILFGRLHLLFLHFPIALAFAVLLLDIARRRRGSPVTVTPVAIVGAFAAAGAIAAVLSGLQLARAEDYGGAAGELLSDHKVGGIITAALLVVAVAAFRFIPRASLLVSTGACLGVVYTGHLGGELVHGARYLSTEPAAQVTAPDDEGPIAPSDGDDGDSSNRERHPQVAVPERPDYATHVAPLLERSCLKCHGAAKRKGGLRLDEKRFAMKGGETGLAIVAGSPSESLLLKYVSLPEDDEDIMPPRGKLLAESEIELLRRWITQGASWPE